MAATTTIMSTLQRNNDAKIKEALRQGHTSADIMSTNKQENNNLCKSSRSSCYCNLLNGLDYLIQPSFWEQLKLARKKER